MTTIECPNCGSPISELQPDLRRRCAHCGAEFAAPQPSPETGPASAQSAAFSSTTLIVNGRTYGSLDEMPPEERALYNQMLGVFTDQDGNGVPDLLEGVASMRQASDALRRQTTIAGSPNAVVQPAPMPQRERRGVSWGGFVMIVIVTALILGLTAWAWLPLVRGVFG